MCFSSKTVCKACQVWGTTSGPPEISGPLSLLAPDWKQSMCLLHSAFGMARAALERPMVADFLCKQKVPALIPGVSKVGEDWKGIPVIVDQSSPN